MKGEKAAIKSQSFIKGALILTISTSIVKFIGAIFKIPLFGILGAEGYGYFASAYDLYNPLFTVATAGFPVAIAKMVSENVARKRYRDVKTIHRVSVPIFTIMGVIGLALMVCCTFVYVNIINAPGAKYATLTLAPTIFFACLMSIYRGYYEGMRNMIPTAISEIIEAACKLFLGLIFSNMIYSSGMNEFYTYGTVYGVSYASESLARSAVLPFAAAGAIVGITIGSCFGFLYLLIRFKKEGDGITKADIEASPKSKSPRLTVKTLVKIAIPIAMGSLVVNIAGFVDVTLIQKRLFDIIQHSSDVLLNQYPNFISMEAITNSKAHTMLYGCYASAAIIMSLIPAVVQTFGISALPSVTRAWTQKVYKKIKSSIESVLKITMLVSIPTGLMISIMSQPIMHLLYGDAPDVNISASVLPVMGIAAIFMAASTPICSMLQAVGRVDLPVKILSIGVVIKVILNYILVGIPQINLQGAGFGTLICYMFITIAALFFLCKETKVFPNMVSIFVKPLLASVIACVISYFTNLLLCDIINYKIGTIIAILLAVIVYLLLLFLFKAITKKEVLMLPKGSKLVPLLQKLKLLK